MKPPKPDVRMIEQGGAQRSILMLGARPAMTALRTRQSSSAPSRVKAAFTTEIAHEQHVLLAEFRIEMN